MKSQDEIGSLRRFFSFISALHVILFAVPLSVLASRSYHGVDGTHLCHHPSIVSPRRQPCGAVGMTALVLSILRFLLLALRELMESFFTFSPGCASARSLRQKPALPCRSFFEAYPAAAWAAP